MTQSDVPLVVNVDPGMSVLDQSAESVDIVFRGSQRDINLLDPKSIKVVVDLTGNRTPGKRGVSLTTHEIEGYRGVRPIKITPSTGPSRVEIELDTEIEKEVAVKPGRTIGVPLFGVVEQKTCQPEFVRLSGPASLLQSVVTVATEPVDVDGRTTSFSAKGLKVLAPSEGTVVEPDSVQVDVIIVQKSSTRSWDDMPLGVRMGAGAATDVSLSPSTVKVTLHGGDEVLKAIERDDIKLFVDCVGLTYGEPHELPVRMHLVKTGNVAPTFEPAKVTVTIQKAAPEADPAPDEGGQENSSAPEQEDPAEAGQES